MCIALVARNHGLETIKELIQSSNFKLIAIFTHKINPKSYDPLRNERNDFKDFKNISEKNRIPFFSIDSRDEKYRLDDFVRKHDFHFLISISWRYIISPTIFKKAKYGSINLHRGELPKYAGVEPIKKALENSENKIVISCHHISEKIDAGEIIFEKSHPSNYDKKFSLEENVDRLKDEITPYFSELTIKSLEYLIGDNKNEK